MNHHAKAPSARPDHRTAGLIGLLALAIAALLAIFAAPALAAPVITIDPSPTASYDTAQVSGTIDPQGEFLSYSFEYSTDETNWSPFAYEGEVPTATPGPQVVSATLKGLKGGTQYSVRLVTTDFSTFTNSPEPAPTFTTLPVARPTVLATDGATAVSYTSAEASGEVQRPSGSVGEPAFDADCRFEYVSADQFAAAEFQGATQVPCVDPGDPTNNPIRTTGPTPVEADLTGLAPNTTYHLRLTASNAGGQSSRQAPAVFTTLAVAAPEVLIDDPGPVTATTAHLSGTINPGGTDPAFAVSWHFQCTPECPGLSGTLAPGTTPQAVQADATGLEPNLKYEVSLVAENVAGPSAAGPKAFSTTAVAPATVTGPALTPATTTATLSGTVDPFGLQGTFYFEYGPDSSYGTKVPPTLDGFVGNGRTATTVSRQITGLQASTTYHYRLVGVSSAGTTPGEDRTFTTEAPTSPSGRAYEMVSPVEKQGISVSALNVGFRASADGNSFLYGTEGGALPDGLSAPVIPRVLATRSSGGWQSTSLDLPQNNLHSFSERFFSTVAVSSDLKRAVVVSQKKLTDDAVEGQYNLYVREPSTGKITLIGSDSNLAELSSEQAENKMFGVSDDARTYAYTAEGQVFLGSEGEGIRLASRYPDGSPASVNDPSPYLLAGGNPVSGDGSRIYMVFGFEFSAPSERGLFLRVNPDQAQSQVLGGECTEPSKACTVRVSPEHTPSRPVIFMGQSPDGRYAAYGILNENDAGATIYRYDAVTKQSTVIVPGSVHCSTQASFITVAERGEAYCQTFNGELIYADKGTVRKAVEDPSSVIAPGGVFQTSPSGRYLIFDSALKLTSYENAGNNEIYLYDRDEETLSCPSCRQDGGMPLGNATTDQTFSTTLTHYFSRAVLNDGTVFFDTPDPLVGSDVDGTRDVYSYRDGRLTLITPGNRPYNYVFKEVTEDGSDVYFVTADPLVAQDRDNLKDAYDARVGGGIAAQNVVAPPECVGLDCRGAAAAPPPPSSTASEALGQPARPARHRKKNKKKQKHQKRHHKAAHKHAKAGRGTSR